MDKEKEQTSPQPFLNWWREQVVASVDHQNVVQKVCEDAGWSAHFAFMTLMSAGIAVLGLLLSSPAVVIGAMLISPLMGPIIGLGFALALFDSAEMRRTLRAVVIGTVMAIGFCALIVILSPLQTVTDEIAARTRPNLFDLLVALFSGLAGTYAMIRGRHGTIVGVAIATALMPPIAVVGFGLATANWTVLAGSFLLFFTNLMTIAASAAVLARIYGFAPDLSPRQTRLQASLVTLTLIALAVPLALSLRQIAWETLASRQAREAIAAHFGADARLSDVEIDYHAEPIEIAATVLTPRYKADAAQALTARISERLGRPVEITLDQLRTGNGDTEAMELAAARGSNADRVVTRLAERLALVAGVTPEQVLVDRTRKRAHVRAAALPGASLGSYRELETRVASAEPDWAVTLIPPAAPLPEVEFDGDEPTEAGVRAIETAAWAARRLRLPLGVTGSRARAQTVLARLREARADARLVEGSGAGANVTLTWLVPGAEAPR
ncbi:MAG TPA: DUF389 domain-containing protein [Allosphingosinicella sp.]|nr:DUF389 domain-containing protein [Allosphingosinicella sp.]